MKDAGLDKELKESLRGGLRRYLAEIGPLADDEKKGLRRWVAAGNSAYENPYSICDYSGRPLDFIEGCRTAAILWEEHLEAGLEGSAETDEGWGSHDDDPPF
jgi:hypothetical protein